MHFRMRYILDGIKLELGKDETLKFPFGGNHAVVVTILRLAEESNPQKTTLICESVCEQNVEQPIQEAFQQFSTGGPLEPTYRALFTRVLSDLYDSMQKVISVFRWRSSLMDGPMKVFSRGTEGYSFNGVDWRDEPRRAVSATISFGHPQPKAAVSEQVVQEIIGLVKQDVDEPLERQLFREAWNLRSENPKAALVIGLAAAEIGFRRLIGPVGGRKAISRLLAEHWPGPPSKYKINGKEIKPSASIIRILQEGIRQRNAVVHEGSPAPNQDELGDVLHNIGQLLWIWDLYAGHAWALEHLSANDVVVT
jgi:hypothetical protein